MHPATPLKCFCPKIGEEQNQIPPTDLSRCWTTRISFALREGAAIRAADYGTADGPADVVSDSLSHSPVCRPTKHAPSIPERERVEFRLFRGVRIAHPGPGHRNCGKEAITPGLPISRPRLRAIASRTNGVMRAVEQNRASVDHRRSAAFLGRNPTNVGKTAPWRATPGVGCRPWDGTPGQELSADLPRIAAIGIRKARAK